MIFKRRTKHYLILTPAEATLALRALLHFRNKALARSIDCKRQEKTRPVIEKN